MKAAMKNNLRALIASEPYLSERLKDVEIVFEPKVLESWSTTSSTFYGDGFVLTGNVTEFLDPVFSSGVTLATVSSQTGRTPGYSQIEWRKC